MRKKARTFFAFAIALPSLLLYLAGAALLILVLSMMASDIDRLDDGHDVSAMHAAFDAFLNGLNQAVVDEGTWNEAYLKVVVNADPAWMDGTWGATARSAQGYDNVLVTDQAGHIIFGENPVGKITGDIGDVFGSARTMLANLDIGISATGDATAISGFATDKDGTMGVAAISIHQTSPTGELTVPRDSRRILWLQKHINSALLQDISVRYQIPLATIGAPVDQKSLALDLVDSAGNAAGTLVWQPDRPGDAAFNHALLIAGLVYFVLGVCLLIGLRLLGTSMEGRAVAAVASASSQAAAAVAEATLEKVTTAAAGTVATGPTDDPLAGISSADFTVEYQPVFDLRAETLIGAEALLRWKKPDKTLLLQETLTPEQNAELVDRVGLLAIRHAATEIAPLLSMMLTITITPQQLLDSVFAEKVAATLHAISFPMRRMQLAVNTGLLPSADQISAPVADLRQYGLSIAFSDFALTPTTAAYMRAGLADRVRLSRAIVADIDTDPAHLALVEATMAVAKTVDFVVSTPGIARKEEAGKLLRLGCREFQGDLLAPPMSIGALTSLLLAPAAKKAG